LGLVIFTLLLVIPTFIQASSFSFRNLDLLQSQSSMDEALSMFKQCERKSFIPMGDLVLAVVSAIITVIFLCFAKEDEQNSTEEKPSVPNPPSAHPYVDPKFTPGI
jgi:hypothetical protein